MTRHHLDPVAMYRGAELLGEVAGQGLISLAEATEAIVEAVHRKQNGGNTNSGLRGRLVWAMRDTATDIERRRRGAMREIARAALVAINERKPAQAVRAAAIDAWNKLPDDIGLAEADAIHIALTMAVRAATP
jgi:hypothetical protein